MQVNLLRSLWFKVLSGSTTPTFLIIRDKCFIGCFDFLLKQRRPLKIKLYLLMQSWLTGESAKLRLSFSASSKLQMTVMTAKEQPIQITFASKAKQTLLCLERHGSRGASKRSQCWGLTTKVRTVFIFSKSSSSSLAPEPQRHFQPLINELIWNDTVAASITWFWWEFYHWV